MVFAATTASIEGSIFNPYFMFLLALGKQYI
jgi:hypothetical protein